MYAYNTRQQLRHAGGLRYCCTCGDKVDGNLITAYRKSLVL